MKGLMQRLISIGADFSTRNTFKAALGVLGIKSENIDRLYVELKNELHKKDFDSIPARKKIVFIPQCLRKSGKCEAKMGKLGLECVNCCGCKAYQAKKAAEKLGYRAFIVPGGSLVISIIKKTRPEAVAGIACLKELVLASESIHIPMKGIELARDGCIDTDISIKKVIEDLK